MAEVLVPHRSPLTPVSHVRSTLLQSSLAVLRGRGLLEAWRNAMDAALAREVEESIAPTWIAVNVAVAHYRACDALNVDQHEIDKIGQQVGDHLQNLLVGLGARTARAAGLDPRHAVFVFDKLYSRVFRGGSISVTQHGPKDLSVQLHGMGVTTARYFRLAYMGHLRAAALSVGVRAVYVKPLRYDARSDVFDVSLAWV